MVEAKLDEKALTNAPVTLISYLFLVSGFAALIYQVAWQRILFVAFGSDMESITIIVSAFMLGLGIGSLIGGILSDRFTQKTLIMFALIELSIGGYAIFSPYLMRVCGEYFVVSSEFVVIIANFILILIPTTLMGATLPVLAAHVARIWHSAGEATGHMYFFNTVGAIFGSFCTGFIFFRYFTLDQTIYFAATLNFLVAIIVYFRLRSFS